MKEKKKMGHDSWRTVYQNKSQTYICTIPLSGGTVTTLCQWSLHSRVATSNSNDGEETILPCVDTFRGNCSNTVVSCGQVLIKETHVLNDTHTHTHTPGSGADLTSDLFSFFLPLFFLIFYFLSFPCSEALTTLFYKKAQFFIFIFIHIFIYILKSI